MRIRLVENMKARILSSLKGRTGADALCNLERALKDPSYANWYSWMTERAGRWVTVDVGYLFKDQFNAGEGPRIDQYYVDAIDFSPEFASIDDYLAAVQRRYDEDWPGSSAEQLPNVRSWVAAGNAIVFPECSPENITELAPNQVFVFGSNLAGRHGKGAALLAMQRFGAEYGCGVGPTGQCYALPTKDENLQTLPLPKIRECVDNFLDYAKRNPEKQFLVTEVGCGLAGLRPYVVAPMFKERTPNVLLPASFVTILKNAVP